MLGVAKARLGRARLEWAKIIKTKCSLQHHSFIRISMKS